MTGEQLFKLYVSHGLCATEYRWEMLSNAMQARWAQLAATLQKVTK